MTAKWTLSVISHGHKHNVERLIKQLSRVLEADRYVLVVTSNMGEDFGEAVNWWPGKLILRSNAVPKSFAANHNAALRNATTEYIATLDPDLELADGPFLSLERLLDGRDAFTIASPQVQEPDGRSADHLRKLPTPRSLLGRLANVNTSSGDDWVAGLFMAMRREGFVALGGFDEKFRLYCEDVDLCLRARLAGGRVLVCSDAMVIHAARRLSHSDPLHFWWHATSVFKLWFSSTYRDYKALKASGVERAGDRRRDL